MPSRQPQLSFFAPSPLEALLREVFGHERFHPGQGEAARAFDAGRDAVVVLPTGGGKSLCYQVPAVARRRRGEGPTLVISPLIALMDDQVSALRAVGVPAVALHSALGDASDQARRDTRDATLIYASPERLASASFRRWMQRLGVAAAAVDESHCISKWGQDFRPDYLGLDRLKSELEVPVIALTATATPEVRGEIERRLGLVDPERVVGDFTRPNLDFSVELIQGDTARAARVVQLVQEVGRGRVVVYAATRKRVQALHKALRAVGLPAGYYHAGRSDSARANAAAAFESGRKPVLVATTAFGMGIDRPDVRLVVHANAAGSLAAYYQQAGRAGRDGLPARCVLLYSSVDAVTHARLRGKSPAPGADAGWTAMQDYVFGARCRQQQLAGYFGGVAEPCGSCDACRDPEGVAQEVARARQALGDRRRARDQRRRADAAVTLDAQQLDAVVSFVDQLRKPLGKLVVARGLRGSRAKDVRRKGLARHPLYGALRGVPERAVLDAIEGLLAAGRLVPKGRKYPTLWIPDKRVRPRREPGARPRRPAPQGLEGSLKEWRKAEARRLRWKPYQVFDNATLKRIVAARPTSRQALLDLKGLGPKRVERFGVDVLRLVAEDG